MEHSPGSAARPLRVAIVGSGPSSFYAAGALFKAEDLAAYVDVFDRLPTPFGLVRGGVAPDHQKIKNVIRVYNKIAGNERFRFFGNVEIGRDLMIDDLAHHYDHIVIATGNETDRTMGVPGEDLEGVHSATEFVGWYNGHPDFQSLGFPLDRARRVAVVGNGNVAIDVTRILARQSEELAATDITDEALAALRTSTVEEVVLLGRRGPAQAAFSPKEIKELAGLETVDLVVTAEDASLDELSREWVSNEAAPSARKNVEFLETQSKVAPAGDGRRILCRFLVSPIEFVGEDGRVTAVRIEHNELYADDRGTPRPRGTGEIETLEVDLVFKAVGYRGVPLEGIPFDERWGTVPNRDGRILDPATDRPIPGQYVVGWAKRGPTGLIGTNGPDSEATVRSMLEDLAADASGEDRDPGEGEDVGELLRSRGVDYASYEDWQRLDEEEVRRGELKGKVRDKLTSLETMMEAIRALRSSA